MNAKTDRENEGMAAMEKVAWTELVVSATAIILVLILLPFFGDAASAAFAVLGASACGLWFLRERQRKTIVDERDREIEQRSKQRGVEAAWMFLLLALIALVLWPRDDGGNEFVTKATLNWLVWIQFSILLGVKGLVGVISYRRQPRAS